MKTITTLSLLAIVAAIAAPQKAQADDETRALIGGLVGGLIIGSIIDNDHDRHTTVVVRDRPHRHHGSYRWETRKVWVSGYYDYRRDRCGQRYRVWVPGYYRYHKERVYYSSSRCDRDRDYRYEKRYRGGKSCEKSGRSYDESRYRSDSRDSDRHDRRDREQYVHSNRF